MCAKGLRIVRQNVECALSESERSSPHSRLDIWTRALAFWKKICDQRIPLLSHMDLRISKLSHRALRNAIANFCIFTTVTSKHEFKDDVNLEIDNFAQFDYARRATNSETTLDELLQVGDGMRASAVFLAAAIKQRTPLIKFIGPRTSQRK